MTSTLSLSPCVCFFFSHEQSGDETKITLLSPLFFPFLGSFVFLCIFFQTGILLVFTQRIYFFIIYYNYDNWGGSVYCRWDGVLLRVSLC